MIDTRPLEQALAALSDAPERTQVEHALQTLDELQRSLSQTLARHAPEGVTVLDTVPRWWDECIDGEFVRGAKWRCYEYGLDADGDLWVVDVDLYDEYGEEDGMESAMVFPHRVPAWLVDMLVGRSE